MLLKSGSGMHVIVTEVEKKERKGKKEKEKPIITEYNRGQ